MHDQRTPTHLLRGRPWAGWGPPFDFGHLTTEVVNMIVAKSSFNADQVSEIMANSSDRGRYLLLARLSVTGHSTVYTGIDRWLARHVAVKIHSDGYRHATQRAIFESQTLARLSHPNIVQIHDMGEQPIDGSGAWLYSVMELCDADLDKWRVGRSWVDILSRVIEAAQGLEYLHENGYIHGDIKPLNILIKNDTAKLADFGHASKTGGRMSVGGTVGYVAPEVPDLGPSFAGDVYALAATLWYCLFGKLPYPPPSGDHVSARAAFFVTTQKAIDRQLEPPAKVPDDMPRAVRLLLVSALDPEPRLRPSLSKFIDALRYARDRDERRARRRRRVPAIAGAIAVAIMLGFSIGAGRYRGSAGAGTGIFDTAASAVAPLARAEIAVRMGDNDAAIAAVYRSYDEVDGLSNPELVRLADSAARVAVALETRGARTEAIEVWYFVVRLYRRAGADVQADSARASAAALTKAGLY